MAGRHQRSLRYGGGVCGLIDHTYDFALASEASLGMTDAICNYGASHGLSGFLCKLDRMLSHALFEKYMTERRSL